MYEELRLSKMKIRHKFSNTFAFLFKTMKPETLFEYETTRNFSSTEKELKELGRLSTQAVQVVLSGKGKIELKAAQYVGVIRFGGRTIQILPKIYPVSGEDNRDEHAKHAMSNLLYLLAYAGELQIRDYQIASLLRRNSDWFEILIHLFVTNLNKEWQRGASRGYEVIEEDLPLLKGKLRIAEHLRRPGRFHKFSVAFDELTVDNALNRVFRFVTERLCSLTIDIDNRKELNIMKQKMESVTLLPNVSVADADAVLLTRLNKQYEPLLNLARMFLNKGAIQLSSGDTASFAFVFDMNKLFESFVINFIKRHQEKILSPDLQGCELIPQARGLSFHLVTKEGKPRHKAKPDLVFRKEERYPLLLDTKYKSLTSNGRILETSSSDIFQMTGYARLFDCVHILLIHPQTSDMPSPLRGTEKAEKGSVDIVTATIDLRVELSEKAGQMQLINELKRYWPKRCV